MVTQIINCFNCMRTRLNKTVQNVFEILIVSFFIKNNLEILTLDFKLHSECLNRLKVVISSSFYYSIQNKTQYTCF